MIKVKKPYLEWLLFRDIEHGLIPLLCSAGVFPKLGGVNIIPQLQNFQNFYDNPDNNTKDEILCMTKWIVAEPTKFQPTNAANEHKKNEKVKVVSRDLKEVLNFVLLQEGLNHKPLILPHVVACMIRFVQTWDELIKMNLMKTMRRYPLFLWPHFLPARGWPTRFHATSDSSYLKKT